GPDYGVDPEGYDYVNDFEIALAEAIAEQEGDDLDEMLAEAAADKSGAVKGEIISVKKYPRYSVPQDVEKTSMILE
ncbi:MAG: hypothetical protein LUC41_00465, partial [Clostridiales bacterium]|nr:hypothetical protein [Clostridiales bacterium]